MKGVTKAMGQMNRQMNLPSLQKIMQEFERQNEKMEMTMEVMGDAVDDALEGDEEEEETEELVSQVLDEIGIDIKSEVLFSHLSMFLPCPPELSSSSFLMNYFWGNNNDVLIQSTASQCTLRRCRCTGCKEQGCTSRSNRNNRKWRQWNRQWFTGTFGQLEENVAIYISCKIYSLAPLWIICCVFGYVTLDKITPAFVGLVWNHGGVLSNYFWCCRFAPSYVHTFRHNCVHKVLKLHVGRHGFSFVIDWSC